MSIALIDYGMGNLGSVRKALLRLGAEVETVPSGAELLKYDRCILPGVGSFGDGMRNLRDRGLDRAILTLKERGSWLFGICLGMQMLLQNSEEAPGEAGLGIFPGAVKRFPETPGYKIPQIGWNAVHFSPVSPIGEGIPDAAHYYFVHSYFVPLMEKTAAAADYIFPFSAALADGHFFAVQFHPEKSQQAGLKLLQNFLKLCGELR